MRNPLAIAASISVLRRVTASGPVLSLHFNPIHPRLLLATCMNGGHSIIDIDECDAAVAVLHTAVEHKKYVVTGKWSPNGTQYLTGSHDGSVHIYGSSSSPDAWSQVGAIEFGNNVESVEWIDCENFYVAVREDNYLHHITVIAASSDADAPSRGISLKEVSKYNLNEYGDDHVSFNVLDLALCPSTAAQGAKAILIATDHHRVILMQVGTSIQLRNFCQYACAQHSGACEGRIIGEVCCDA
jgi:WD40 repeat protein